MADDDAMDSQALTGGDITRYRALVARISCLSQDRPDLKFASMRVCCAMAKPSMRDMECVKSIGRYLVGKPRAKCGFRWQQSGDLEACSDAGWRGDRATRRSVSAGVIKGLGIRSVARNLGISCRLNLHLDALASMCLVNRRGHAKPLDTGGFQVRPVRHETRV